MNKKIMALVGAFSLSAFGTAQACEISAVYRSVTYIPPYGNKKNYRLEILGFLSVFC